MKEEQVVDIKVVEEARDKVMNRIVRAHIEGLDVEKAKELGLFDRISMLLTGMVTLQSVAYRLFGGVNYLLDLCGADNKREIRIACNKYQQAFDDYLRFWGNYYMTKSGATKEMNAEAETLYHQFMRWACMPEMWSLGDPQYTSEDTETLMELDEGDGNMLLRFYRSIISHELVGEAKEAWMVSRYDRVSKKQFSIEDGLDKATAQMIAKRLSDNDRESIYIVNLVRDFTEKQSEALPVKAYRGNEVVSNVRKLLKKG